MEGECEGSGRLREWVRRSSTCGFFPLGLEMVSLEGAGERLLRVPKVLSSKTPVKQFRFVRTPKDVIFPSKSMGSMRSRNVPAYGRSSFPTLALCLPQLTPLQPAYNERRGLKRDYCNNVVVFGDVVLRPFIRLPMSCIRHKDK
jgi:hypothetical protein